MCEAIFHFLGDLDYFLSNGQRDHSIAVPLSGRVAVKHPIESLGVPHPEIGLIVVNGTSVGFAHHLQPGDEVHVHPWAVMSYGAAAGQLRPRLAHPVRFVLDVHLGQLAVYLRLFGFDALYSNVYDDVTLAQITDEQGRVLLTRDRGLLKRRMVVHGHCVRWSSPCKQLVSVLQRYDLFGDIHPWRRCLRCNGLLESVEKEKILDRLEPKTKLYYEQFQRCADCDQIYWQGSHYTRNASICRRCAGRTRSAWLRASTKHYQHSRGPISSTRLGFVL